MEDGQPPLHFEDIIGENMLHQLDEWDRYVRQRYLELADHFGLRLFEDCLHLHSRLLLSTVIEIPGFLPKFARSSSVQHVVAASAVGSFRNLRVAYKLLMEGYFAEMHNILRMVEQWCECATVVEAFPEIAGQILQHGMQKKHIGTYLVRLRDANTEVGELYRGMRKTFHMLSQRAHPLPAAFRLITRENDEALYVSGNLSKEMFGTDALFLASMGRNALVALRRHFQETPSDWNATFEDRGNRILLMQP